MKLERKIEAVERQLDETRQSLPFRLYHPIQTVYDRFAHRATARRRLNEQAKLLRDSPLFDADWYLRAYPEVAQDGVDPEIHYLVSGAREGRAPGPCFCGVDYLARYPDVARSGVNPLVHYIARGRDEGRSATPAKVEERAGKEKGR
jgi:hypothetical protein